MHVHPCHRVSIHPHVSFMGLERPIGLIGDRAAWDMAFYLGTFEHVIMFLDLNKML